MSLCAIVGWGQGWGVTFTGKTVLQLPALSVSLRESSVNPWVVATPSTRSLPAFLFSYWDAILVTVWLL